MFLLNMEQQLTSEFEELEVDTKFISAKMEELSRKYNKQFIAVKGGQLIATGKTFDEVLDKVKKIGVDPASVLIEYLPDKGEIILY